MNRSHLWKLLIIVVVVGWAATEMLPYKSRPLIEVFQENIGRRDGTYTNILARFAELQKANPENEYKNLLDAIGTNDISRHFDVDTKGAKNPSQAILNWVQRKAAGKIKLGLDLQGGSSFVVQMETGKLATNISPQVAVENAVEVLRKRVDKFGVAEPIIQPQGEREILIQMPGLGSAEMERVKIQLQKAAFLEFRLVHEDNENLLRNQIIPPGYEILREPKVGQDGQKGFIPYVVSKTPIPGLTGKNVKSAGMARDAFNNPEIIFSLDDDGAVSFEKVTRENVGRSLAIILDGELYSAPVIRGAIPGGHGSISGSFTDEEARNLAAILQNPLEAPVSIISEDRVDPSLGKDTIRSGIQSAIYGTLAVALFMAVYYLAAGMVANFALLLNLIILLGAMCMIKTTLTLPGIAGIVLTAGMAVDANVLIFERIREELAKGKSLRGALSAGYSRAFGTIFDSHVTTLISSIILWKMGTGTIKGFGVALTIGVAASLFTALVVTRLIFDAFISLGWMKSLPMLHLIRSPNIDFMRWAKPAFVTSWLIILVGVGYGISRGKHMLGFEFQGGDKLTISFAQKVDVDKVREAIKPAVDEALIQYQRGIVGTTETLGITSSFDSTDKIMSALQKDFPQAGLKLEGSKRVGPTVGEQILRSAVIAFLLSLLGILVYVAFRYEFSFAIAAIVAILHDIFMTVGIYALSGRELNSTVIAAILTIIGFSINDTIVIFDRIREDLKLGVRGTFRELINKALNQTLSRTLITSGTVFLATLSLYVFGGGAINDFAFTFLAGIITGTYSSIYIASALVLWWHKGQRPQTSTQVTMETASTAVKV
ncbi:MAG TPA: protein translocase subunit SecD [Candidatus Limnocylindria bacterium]|nr:protein translocase subunit SecD [Candidatus Limnocylindria bacterium]